MAKIYIGRVVEKEYHPRSPIIGEAKSNFSSTIKLTIQTLPAMVKTLVTIPKWYGAVQHM